jgi:hypothetical protein
VVASKTNAPTECAVRIVPPSGVMATAAYLRVAPDLVGLLINPFIADKIEAIWHSWRNRTVSFWPRRARRIASYLTAKRNSVLGLSPTSVPPTGGRVGTVCWGR